MKKTLSIYRNRHSIMLNLLFLLLTSKLLYAQNITGTVSANSGEKLSGVSVIIKGTNKGTTTNREGVFTIDVRKNQILIFSFVGYELQESIIGDQKTINISLNEALASLEEVVVTAENRSVSAQRVPITMDLVRGKDIQKQGITDLLQLQNIAPSLNIITNTVFNQINVRGVGSNQGAAELSDQAVTVGIDGEYLNRPIALNASMFDLDRVEVLKGPQGTLYGRNATAGAVNIVAKKPTQTLEADLGMSYGNYNSLKLNGMVNLPLGKIAAIRAAGILSKHDGYRDGGALVGKIDNGNMYAARLGLSLNPAKALSVYIAGEINKTDQQAPSQYGVNMGTVTDLKGKEPTNWTISLPNDYPVATTGFMKIDQSALRGKMAYDFGKATLTYSGGTRKVSMTGYQPLNGFVPETFSFYNDIGVNTQSHELRLNGESSKLIWQLGGFYGNEDQLTKRGLFLPSAAGAFGGQIPFLNFFIRDVSSKTSAVFAQATYNVSEKLGLTLGLRNTTDTKKLGGGNLASAPFGPPSIIRFFYPNAPTSATQAGMKPFEGIPTEGSWNRTTWLLGLEYKMDANKMLFAKVSTGYKAGGFDNLGQYNPEDLTAYEIGTKNKFANNKLRLNASAFHYDYKNQQVSIFISTAIGGAIQNAGVSSVNGLEIDGEYVASKADRFKFSVNLLDATYSELKTVANVVNGDVRNVDLTGKVAPMAPKVTITAGYNHDFKIGSGVLNAGIQTLFKSNYYTTAFNYEMDKQPSYTKTDLNITYTAKGGKFDVGLFAQNLEDNRIITYSSFNGGTINIYNWIFGTPRLMGAQLNYHFLK
ncbi:iron complex outermembrane receptor protein [Arcicella aurantiaca]|uniref:Iron complex outermembrane receptor protein n=1 Tax=Arcicella aurantiaca TaxID=591202 RepID=A0A316DU91_9BACT|nr:TonB-dependent receptor [Arcicella aurantiaca]PWK21634.1 iron complex outermembrane receptor protein [Arcicella aurantiaca]